MTISETAVMVEKALKNAGIEATVDSTRADVALESSAHAPKPIIVEMRVKVYGIRPNGAGRDET